MSGIFWCPRFLRRITHLALPLVALSIGQFKFLFLALPLVALSNGQFFDISELVACEQAQIFTPHIFEWLWDVAAWQWLESIVLWNNAVNQFVEKGLRGKKLISAITCFRRAVFSSKQFRPWIVEKSFRSIKAIPALVTVGVSDRACVAVAVGATRGQSLVLGMKFAAAGPVNDNLYIGIEALGCAYSGRMMSIALAPFSGSCFIENENGLRTQCQALPNVHEVLEGFLWVQVTDKGGIRFLRQFKGRQLEDTGLLPPEMFPTWIQSYFASIDIRFNDLESAIDVSVEHSGSRFPNNMPVSKVTKKKGPCDLSSSSMAVNLKTPGFCRTGFGPIVLASTLGCACCCCCCRCRYRCLC